jgi:hypothetical protein
MVAVRHVGGKRMRTVSIAAAIAVALLSATITLAGPPLRVHLQNKSNATVTEIYVVIAGSRDGWGSNFIAGAPLQAGGKTQLLVPDGADKCVVDIKIEADNKPKYEKRVRLCENKTFAYHGR